MCPSAYSSTLVMDVEGTDGRERGEDQDFERKSALFSLASTEVLIVNLWEHQIGLYQGANMGLLKTVFEVNLGLFGGGGDGTKVKYVRTRLGCVVTQSDPQTAGKDPHPLCDPRSRWFYSPLQSHSNPHARYGTNLGLPFQTTSTR